ncbi:MAG: glycosyltransferase family 2 protein [Rudaea sp.]
MLAIAIVNYRTAEATIACLQGLLHIIPDDCRVHVLDNGSDAADVESLQRIADSHPSLITFVISAVNLGFAAGCNRLIAQILDEPRVDTVLFLNSDTRPDGDFISPMRAALQPEKRVDMVAARMVQLADDAVDSLGITLFRSTLASNRKSEREVLLGPSGGCALVTRRLLDDLWAAHGEWFDETFFCYAEDTDLIVRARWLGYRTAYAATATIHHAGALSSGGPDNDFVLYHGIRNSLWWLRKNAPLGWFIRSLPWFIAMHVAIVFRHVRRGRARVVWQMYRDAIHGLASLRTKRAVIRRSRRVPVADFASWVDPHFYQADYVRRALRELWRR